MKYVVSWSGGYDSTATVCTLYEKIFRGDEGFRDITPEDVTLVYSEVMYDNKNNVFGETVEQAVFIRKAAEQIRNRFGFKVLILRSDRDYLSVYNRRMDADRVKDESHAGMRYGFPLTLKSGCVILRDCKLRPIKCFIRELKKTDDVTQFVGIAANETARLYSLHNQKGVRSLLEEEGITHDMAKEICVRYHLENPAYSIGGHHSGCWMCANSQLLESVAVYLRDPALWESFVRLESEAADDVCHQSWNVKRESLVERDKAVKEYVRHMGNIQ